MMVNFLPFSLDSGSISYGASKIGQILLPLGSYILFRELPFREKLFNRFNRIYEKRFERLLGFMTWKIGCDLGFFLVLTTEPWQRAFTFAGLIPYTISQYIFYRIIGQKMLIGGLVNPLGMESPQKPPTERPHALRQIFSKYFHEDMNATSHNVPIRKILLKPLIDYSTVVLSWSIYTMGILFVQSGEINFSPFINFSHASMIAFYLGGSFGYILGYNLGESLYLWLLKIQGRFVRWKRGRKRLLKFQVPHRTGILGRLQYLWKEDKYLLSWRFQPFLRQYGLNTRWMVSTISGVLTVALLTPRFASAMASLTDTASQFWFHAFGQMNQVQLEQVQRVDSADLPNQRTRRQGDKELPDSNTLIKEFPKIWEELYSD